VSVHGLASKSTHSSSFQRHYRGDHCTLLPVQETKLKACAQLIFTQKLFSMSGSWTHIAI